MASQNQPAPEATRPSTLGELVENVRLAWRLLLDSRVNPLIRFGIPALVVGYILFPVDVLPDVIPGLGQIDDVAIIWLGLQLFLKLVPSDLVAKHRTTNRAPEPSAKPEGDVVDVPYEVVED